MGFSDSPAFQFYPKDFLTSERQIGMTAAEAGIYMRLICHCWLSDTLPNIPRVLAKMAAVSNEEFSACWPAVLQCFYLNPQGRLQHARLDKERLKQQEFRRRQSDKGKKGATKRWPRPSSGDSTGNTEGMPSDSSSSPISDLLSSSPISNLQSPLSNLQAAAAPKNGARRAGSNGNGHTDARSKRPIFTGQRLTVFEWMLDDCMQILGPLTDAFDLHEWFFTLDAQAAKTSMVIPKRDSGAWLQAQLLAEAQRRNLPIASVQTKSDSLTASNVENAKRAIARITNRS